ncbi:MAG: HNH endonuclease [Thermodesulfobacteriota bacterium]
MHPDFDLPGRSKITGRKSTITGLFLTSITPIIEPTDAEVREALAVLGMTESHCVCACCGDRRTEWDHFRPIVKDRKPTGYITEIANLVPSCGKCNQSKGNKPWQQWITSSARHAPANRNVADLPQRIKRLEAYETWRKPVMIDYIEVLGADEWGKHMQFLDQVLKLLAEAENHAAVCRVALGSYRKGCGYSKWLTSRLTGSPASGACRSRPFRVSRFGGP